MQNEYISKLLSVKEKISLNLSSQQIARILDKLLWAAVNPILLATNLGKDICAEILLQYYSDSRRKISLLPRQEFINLLFTTLVTPKPEIHATCFQQLKFERTVQWTLIDYFLKLTNQIKQLDRDYVIAKSTNNELQASQILDKINIISEKIEADPNRLAGLIRWVEAFAENYLVFKGYIVQKFIKLSWEEALKSRTNSSRVYVDLKDFFSNNLMAVDKAIDRYSPDAGALANYVQWWILNAKTSPEFPHLYSQSYTVPVAERRSLAKRYTDKTASDTNFAYPLEGAEDITNLDTLEDVLSQNSYSSRLVDILSHAKFAKFAILSLSIPTYLSPDDIAKQKQTKYLQQRINPRSPLQPVLVKG